MKPILKTTYALGFIAGLTAPAVGQSADTSRTDKAGTYYETSPSAQFGMHVDNGLERLLPYLDPDKKRAVFKIKPTAKNGPTGRIQVRYEGVRGHDVMMDDVSSVYVSWNGETTNVQAALYTKTQENGEKRPAFDQIVKNARKREWFPKFSDTMILQQFDQSQQPVQTMANLLTEQFKNNQNFYLQLRRSDQAFYPFAKSTKGTN